MTERGAKIRVLHVIKNLNLGGAETNLLNLVQAFDAKRFEHHVAYSGRGDFEAHFRAAGLQLFRYADGDHKIKSLATLPIILRLAGYLRSKKIDIVHTHNFNAHAWGCLAAKLAGKKLLEHVHDYRYLDSAEYARRHGTVDQFRFIRYFKGLSDRVVVLTSQNREYLLANHFYPEMKIREIRNGIPLVDVSVDALAVRLSLGLPADACIVLTPARMSEEKNLELVIDIAVAVKQRAPKALFVIAGDGPLFPALRERVESSGASHAVHFTGFYPKVRELLAASDVFLLPSFLELHSIAILEALSAGVPVTASAGVGCNSDVLTHGRDVMLLDPFHKEDWVGPLADLVNDASLRRRIGQAGRDLCWSQFDIRKVAGQFEGLYEEMIHE